MKKYTLPFLILALSVGLLSCKKEKSPELEITVLDQNGEAVHQILVRTSVPGIDDLGNVMPNIIDSVRTDAFGKAFFEYDNTILLRVDAFYDSSNILDSTDVLLETKRLKNSQDNYYERTLRVTL